MHTRRSFLAWAAMAQLASPLSQARTPDRGRPPLLRPPQAVLQLHPGRDVHFHNDLATGRLTILDLRHAAGLAVGTSGVDILRGARQVAGSKHAHDFYLYSLTRQAAIGNTAALQRYMDWYGAAGGIAPPAEARDDIELLRLRFGVYRSGR